MATTGATCGAETSDGGACQLPAGEDGTCHLHDAPTEYTAPEYRQMDRATAEAELSEAQLEQWRQWNDLYDDAEATKAELQRQTKSAVDTFVKSDMGVLTERVTVFGNEIDALVNLDREQRRLVRQLEDHYEQIPEDASEDDLSDERIDEMLDLLTDFFASTIYRFNGEILRTYDEPVRKEFVRVDLIDNWGLTGSVKAMMDISETLEDTKQKLQAQQETFR